MKKAKKFDFKAFFNFETYITETVLKILFIIYCILTVISAAVILFGGWIAGIGAAVAAGGGAAALLVIVFLIGSPIAAAIWLFLSILSGRIYFECILIFYQIMFRAVKILSTKVKEIKDAEE